VCVGVCRNIACVQINFVDCLLVFVLVLPVVVCDYNCLCLCAVCCIDSFLVLRFVDTRYWCVVMVKR